jgi:hypothetical protein
MTATDRRPRRWPRPSSPREARIEIWLIVGLLLLGVVLPLVVSAFAGSLEIPRNDDWSYRRTAVGFATTGRITLDGGSLPLMIGQALFTWPFLSLSGFEPWGFAVVGVVFAIGAVASAYALARQVLPARLAVIPVVLLLLMPGYLAYATSYMSDVPAMVGAFACLAIGAHALKRTPVRTGFVLASVAVGFFAFTIRDFAVAAPASVVVATLCVDPRRRYWLIAIALGVACAGVYAWRATLPGQFGDLPFYPNGIVRIIEAVFSAALVLSPAAILAAARWRHHWRRFDVIVGAELGLVLVGLRVIQWVSSGNMPLILLDNLMSQWGSPGPNVLPGVRPVLFPDPVWSAFNVLAMAAVVITFAIGAGIAGVHIRRSRSSLRGAISRVGSPPGLMFIFVVATTAGLAVFGMRFSLFDRYLWPLVVPMATLFLYVPQDLQTAASAGVERPAQLPFTATAVVVGLVLASFSVTYLLNSNAFDAGRWRAGEALVQLGLAADQVDAGYEWMGGHATSRASVVTPGSGQSYRDLWPSFQLCGFVSSSPQAAASAELVGTESYRLHLVAGETEALYLYRLTTPECVPAAD